MVRRASIRPQILSSSAHPQHHSRSAPSGLASASSCDQLSLLRQPLPNPLSLLVRPGNSQRCPRAGSRSILSTSLRSLQRWPDHHYLGQKIAEGVAASQTGTVIK